ncbi:MAG: branched-chain amino acid aminotransferase [Syntrophomonadaceae bacterium]|jgi:branched-chain amino acid aminotransferase|nr:branched-chain amino acid aminotransferase [Syntrophomonadaceae bacterium]
MALDIAVTKNPDPKSKPDQNHLGFGHYFTDHMFLLNYTSGKGWHDPRIVPYGPLSFDPATDVLHYAQSVFEGLKAYKSANGDLLLFRPYANAARLNLSCERLCIPKLEPEAIVEAIKAVVKVDREWIPSAKDTSLYIRPFVISTDVHIGVKPASTYLFIIILSPVGAYYPEGINPVKIFVENKFARTVKGGMGQVKAAGNYAASLLAQAEAAKKGFTQVLWLDAIEKRYVDEVGTMNVFFKINGEVVTPTLTEETLLAGITRDSVIRLLKHWGVKVNETKIAIDEIYQAHKQGLLEEAFGTGTAAVISPIGELNWDGDTIVINNFETGETAKKLYDFITGVQSGVIDDPFEWTVKID